MQIKALNKQILRLFKGVKNFLEGNYGIYEKFSSSGEDLINNPSDNRFSGFTSEERERFRITGLIPPAHFKLEEQLKIHYEEFQKGSSFDLAMNPDENIKSSGVTIENIRKFLWLQELQNENEILFYKLVLENIEEMAPIIYTPTVGWFCKNFSRTFRRPRGMFISAMDRGRVAALLANWPHKEVDAIVVTDGSRILGLGDLGIGGMGISIGKMNLYVAAGGFNPSRIMPVVIDVGTDNQQLRDDPYYLGLRCPRLNNEPYQELIDEFIACVTKMWPNVLVQFEDFQFKHAMNLLKRYRDEFLVFNDDIQGTASIVLAGILGALKLQKNPHKGLSDHRFVIVGSGAAGQGIIFLLTEYLKRTGLSQEEALSRIFVVGREGLITKQSHRDESFTNFARSEVEYDKLPLVEVIRKFRPTALIGVTGQPGIFDESVLEAMKHQDEGNFPIIFPLSNPTANSECTAEEAFRYTEGRAIFGSGSPFKEVTLGGKTHKTNLTNNVYVYPGLAFGAFIGQTRLISDSMLITASEALAEMLSAEDLAKGCIFPSLQNIRQISLYIAARVIEQAHRDNHMHNLVAQKFLETSFDDLLSYVGRMQWVPSYENVLC